MPPNPPPLETITTTFLRHLPRALRPARFALRHIRCPDTRADLMAETVALAWKYYLALTQRGRNPEAFVSVLARRATQAVRAGRRLAGCDPARDVLSPVARGRHGVVERLPLRVRDRSPLAEALADNTLTPVPEQVCFRSDFPAWLATRTDQDRELIAVLMAGERTTDAARAFGLSPCRVSRLRGEYLEDWVAFGEGAGDAPTAATRRA